jgi:hypothetical protein
MFRGLIDPLVCDSPLPARAECDLMRQCVIVILVMVLIASRFTHYEQSNRVEAVMSNESSPASGRVRVISEWVENQSRHFCLANS